VLTSKEPFPVAERAERMLDRRRFLAVATGAALLGAAGEWLAGRAGADSARLDVTLSAAELPVRGAAHAVAATDGREALVVRLAAGDVVAFDRRCPHLGCPVLWSAERARFECPCHHAAFDARSGRVLFGPPRRGLEAATVRTA